MAGLDPLVILKMSDAMHAHSAADVLGSIRVPALVVSGTRDTFTPPSLAEDMRDAIPHAEHVVIDGGTHGTVIEKPGEVNSAIRSFLERHLEPANRATGQPGAAALDDCPGPPGGWSSSDRHRCRVDVELVQPAVGVGSGAVRIVGPGRTGDALEERQARVVAVVDRVVGVGGVRRARTDL